MAMCELSVFSNWVKWPILCIVLFFYSTSGWRDRGVVCLRNGMGFKHRAGQELYVALLRKWTAAGHIQDHSVGVWPTVSFYTPNLWDQTCFTLWFTLYLDLHYVFLDNLCVRFDVETRHAFVGDHSGQVTILKLDQDSCSLVTTFKGHTGAHFTHTHNHDNPLYIVLCSTL